ncbi:hypothetical protein Dimus_038204 [Dionaea muscipula]
MNRILFFVLLQVGIRAKDSRSSSLRRTTLLPWLRLQHFLSLVCQLRITLDGVFKWRPTLVVKMYGMRLRSE